LTIARIMRFVPSPFLACHSDWPIFHHMHQQPAHAPFFPNSAAKSSQRAGVTG
jgi:hypothetical protein